MLATGCGSAPKGEGLVDKALELVGLQKLEPPAPALPPVPAAEAPKPVKLPLRIHAGDRLNTGASQRSLSLVVKVYRLKDPEAFLRVPYETFSAPTPLASPDVVSSREVVLLPGQRYEVEEVLPPEVTHLAVVALFQKPEPFRWRFVFDAKESAKQGVTLGAHQCALSVSQGKVVGSAPEAHRLAGSVCQ